MITSKLKKMLKLEAAVSEQLPTYKTVTTVYDWGPSINKLVVNLGVSVAPSEVNKNSFKVHVRRYLAEGTTTFAGHSSVVLGSQSQSPEDLEGDVNVIDVYTSDANGNRTDKRGSYVTIELPVSPTSTLTAALNYDPVSGYNDWVDARYTITATQIGQIPSMTIDNKNGNIRPQADKFSYATMKVANHQSYGYASYEPKDNAKHPLIVWLHGMGEGGTGSPSIAIMGNKAVEFAEDSIQHYFDGAYVLAPQARTYWMHGYEDFADGTSIYSDTLMELIRGYIKDHPNVDSNRVYVGGDSNGGYMTMLLIRDNPGFFAAAFPTCEGLADNMITETDLRNIAKTPTWFVAAKTDTVLPPNDYAVPTYNRLKGLGANVHFSYFDNVLDDSGMYKKADGSPYEYMGHWSWIYVYNDKCEETVNGITTKLFQWMANQHR